MSESFQFTPPWKGLRDILERGLRPAVGFSHPLDVVKDPHLDTEAKRAILSSWASDASAVENWPKLRWLYGTERPVLLADVMDALASLEPVGVSRSAPTNSGQQACFVGA
jgi:hypothetical protein